MNKLIKNKKGFSMIELLVALLIMAVIAAIAITLYNGVLTGSKSNADVQTADEIKKQILVYMNLVNDDANFSKLATATTGFSIGKFVKATAKGTDLVDALSQKFTIDGIDYGPFLELNTVDTPNHGPRPQNKTTNTGWEIAINTTTQIVSVKPATTANDKITWTP